MFDLIPFGRTNQPAKREDLFNHMLENFFKDDFFAPLTTSGSSSFRVDLKERDDAYLIEADLPGMKKGDISLQYVNNYLTITAKRQDDQESKGDNYLRRERRYGEFQRSFYVNNIQDDKIDAEFKDGVLMITLPKRDKSVAQSSTITIR